MKARTSPKIYARTNFVDATDDEAGNSPQALFWTTGRHQNGSYNQTGINSKKLRILTKPQLPKKQPCKGDCARYGTQPPQSQRAVLKTAMDAIVMEPNSGPQGKRHLCLPNSFLATGKALCCADLEKTIKPIERGSIQVLLATLCNRLHCNGPSDKDLHLGFVIAKI